MRWLLPFILIAVIDSPAAAGIRVVSERCEIDRAAGVAAFTVRFDAAPDFHTLDEFGRLADSFQYEIDDDPFAPAGLPVDGLDAVVRGDEIHLADALRIRDADFNRDPNPDPAAGGWGDVLAEVPFRLDGNELRFEAAFAAVGDDDGAFAYRLFTTEFGLTTSEVESRVLPPDVEPPPAPPPPVAIPLPPAVHGAFATLALFAAARLARYFVGGLRSTAAFARNPSSSNVNPK